MPIYRSSFLDGRVPHWLSVAGVFLTAVYVFLRIWHPLIGQRAGTVIAVVALFAIFIRFRELRSNTVFWCLFGAVTAQLITWTTGYFHHPEWIPDNPELDRLGKWFLFVGVAFWLGGHVRLSLLLLVLALSGFLAACLSYEGLSDHFLRGLVGQRVDFGVRNAQHTAMFFGVAVIGLLAFSRRCFFLGKLSWASGLLWVFTFSTCLLGVVITQTRAVWLGLSLTGIVAIFVYIVLGVRGYFTRSFVRQGLLFISLVFIFLSVSFYFFKDTVINRLQAEGSVFSSVWKGDWEAIPYSSIGNRLHSWRAAIEWFLDRPVVGWGGEARGLVIDETKWLSDYTKENFGHLHNTILDFAVSYGVLGISVIFILALWTAVGSFKAWRSRTMPTDVFVFAWAFFIYYFVVSLFESYSFFWTGSYIQNVVMGVVVTFIWRWQLETGKPVFNFGNKKHTSVNDS